MLNSHDVAVTQAFLERALGFVLLRGGRSVDLWALEMPAGSVDAWIAFSRSTGSLMSVARLHSIPDTWLVDSVLPGGRSETGTNATSGSLGKPCFSSR